MLLLRTHSVDGQISNPMVVEIETTLEQALERFTYMIREARITLRDLNGPKGGVDKQCKIQLWLYPRGLAVVSSKGGSYSEAASDACKKLRQVIIRRVQMRKKKARVTFISTIAEQAAHGC